MRLAEDSSSWHARSLIRRNFRQSPLTPDQEVSRRKSTTKKYKKKHKHTYTSRVIGKHIVRRYYRKIDGSLQRIEHEQNKVQYVCTGCGHKRNSYSWGW